MVGEGEVANLSGGSVGRLDPATSREGGLKSDLSLTTFNTSDHIPPASKNDHIPPLETAPILTPGTRKSDAGEETGGKTERGESPKTLRPKRPEPEPKRDESKNNQ